MKIGDWGDKAPKLVCMAPCHHRGGRVWSRAGGQATRLQWVSLRCCQAGSGCLCSPFQSLNGIFSPSVPKDASSKYFCCLLCFLPLLKMPSALPRHTHTHLGSMHRVALVRAAEVSPPALLPDQQNHALKQPLWQTAL